MALKDRFNKLISYFDTDDISDVEEEKIENIENDIQIEQKPQKPQRPQRPERPSTVVRSERELGERNRLQSVSATRPKFNREQMAQNAAESANTTIVIKYPKKYEDAQEIVDALILNESVLIDFQFMIDAQARRCLDFIDGASKVLFGNLQKVSSSMFLLTPANVKVDFDEIGIPNNGQDINYDYDMKR